MNPDINYIRIKVLEDQIKRQEHNFTEKENIAYLGSGLVLVSIVDNYAYGDGETPLHEIDPNDNLTNIPYPFETVFDNLIAGGGTFASNVASVREALKAGWYAVYPGTTQWNVYLDADVDQLHVNRRYFWAIGYMAE